MYPGVSRGEVLAGLVDGLERIVIVVDGLRHGPSKIVASQMVGPAMALSEILVEKLVGWLF